MIDILNLLEIIQSNIIIFKFVCRIARILYFCTKIIYKLCIISFVAMTMTLNQKYL